MAVAVPHFFYIFTWSPVAADKSRRSGMCKFSNIDGHGSGIPPVFPILVANLLLHEGVGME